MKRIWSLCEFGKMEVFDNFIKQNFILKILILKITSKIYLNFTSLEVRCRNNQTILQLLF